MVGSACQKTRVREDRFSGHRDWIGSGLWGHGIKNRTPTTDIQSHLAAFIGNLAFLHRAVSTCGYPPWTFWTAEGSPFALAPVAERNHWCLCRDKPLIRNTFHDVLPVRVVSADGPAPGTLIIRGYTITRITPLPLFAALLLTSMVTASLITSWWLIPFRIIITVGVVGVVMIPIVLCVFPGNARLLHVGWLTLTLLAGWVGSQIREAHLFHLEHGSDTVVAVGGRVVRADGVTLVQTGGFAGSTSGHRIRIEWPPGWNQGRISIGDSVFVLGKYRPARHPLNPGEWNVPVWLAAERVSAVVSGISVVRLIGARGGVEAPAVDHHGLRVQILAAMLDRIVDLFPDRTARVVQAMLLGDRSSLAQEDISVFRRSGLSHLLAVSGLHVGVLCGAMLLILRAFLLRTSLSPQWRLIWMTASVTFIGFAYGWLLAWPPSVTRAILMMTVGWSSRWVGREGWLARGWLVSLVVILAVRPAAVFDLGAQLSFAAVGGISLAGSNLVRKNEHHPALDAIRMTCAATMATTPFLLWHIGWVPLNALIASPLAIPVASISLLAAFTALVLPVGSSAVATLATMGFDGLGWLAYTAASGWNPLMVTSTASWWLVSGMLSTTLWFTLTRPCRRFIRLAPAFVLFSTALLLGRSSTTRLSITMLDVGQGDALVIERPHNRGLIIDTGPGVRSARILEQFLSRRGHRKVDLIVTHADRDHAGGARYLLDHFPVENAFSAWSSGVFTPVRAGDRLFASTPVRILVLHPGKPGHQNESSVVVLAALPGIRVLLTGDAGVESEESIVHAWRPLLTRVHPGAFHVLKVGHHGSRTSTGEHLVSVFRPDVSLISAGRANSFGHPHADVLERLARSGSRVFSTLGSGAIRIQFRRKGVAVDRWTGHRWSRVDRRESVR